jgi:ribosomal protein S18 acetylase RimI-like enzyme
MDPEVKLSVGGAAEAVTMVDELAALYVNDFVDPPLKGTFFYSDERFRSMLFDDYIKQAGFTVVTARAHGELIGFVDGCPLPCETRWWSDVREGLSEEFTQETGSRTFALLDIVVKKEWRGQKVARALHSKLLEGRQEERVTLLSTTNTQPGYSMWLHYGYKKVGTSEPPGDGTVLDAFVYYLKNDPSLQS